MTFLKIKLFHQKNNTEASVKMPSLNGCVSFLEDKLRGNEKMDLEESQKRRGRRQEAILDPGRTHL